MLLKIIPLFFKYVSPIFPRLCSWLAFELFCRPQRIHRKKIEQDFWMTGTNIDLKSKRVAKSWGQGPVVWFLHGWASKGSTYYKVVPQFVEAGFQVVLWDGPAHGDSPGKKVNILSYTNAVAEDLKHFNHPIHAIVGHSFGGASLALFPGRINIPSFLVSIGAPTEVPIIFSNYKRLIQLGDQAFNILVNRAEQILGRPLSTASLISNDLSKHANVLVIHDEDDKEVPFKRFTKLKSIWQGGSFLSTKGLGHNRILKDAHVAKKIIAFISST